MIVSILFFVLTMFFGTPAFADVKGWTVYGVAERIELKSHNDTYDANLVGIGVLTPELGRVVIHAEALTGKLKGTSGKAWGFTVPHYGYGGIPTGYTAIDFAPADVSETAMKFRVSVATDLGKGFFLQPTAEFFKAGEVRNNSYQLIIGYRF